MQIHVTAKIKTRIKIQCPLNFPLNRFQVDSLESRLLLINTYMQCAINYTYSAGLKEDTQTIQGTKELPLRLYILINSCLMDTRCVCPGKLLSICTTRQNVDLLHVDIT